MHLQCLPIKKKNYGCVGYIDDPSPNIVYIAPMALLRIFLHYKVLLEFFLHFVALLCIPSALRGISGQLFFFSA